MPKEWDGSWTPRYSTTRNIVDDFGNLMRVRRCAECRRSLPEDAENFTIKKRGTDGSVVQWDWLCREDRRARNNARARRVPLERRQAIYRQRYLREKADAEKAARRRARQREIQKRYRDRHPERERESKRRWEAKVRANPQRYAERLADNRMNYWLRKERNGTPLEIAETKNASGPDLPLGPLVDALLRKMERLGITIDIGNNLDDGYERFCDSIGLSPRTMLAWRTGARSMVRLSTLEKILANTDWHWWDVYGPGDEGYDKVREAFEGE